MPPSCSDEDRTLILVSTELEPQISLARQLFREYVDALALDLGFQDFEAELAGLPGKYAAPCGRLILAWHRDQLAGCIALRPLDGDIGEVKRLYVRPESRGRGVARRLATAVVEAAREIGYRRLRLDTLSDRMPEAVALYRSLGFRPIPPYYHNPLAGAEYFELILDRSGNG